jgi:hypothetical protein
MLSKIIRVLEITTESEMSKVATKLFYNKNYKKIFSLSSEVFHNLLNKTGPYVGRIYHNKSTIGGYDRGTIFILLEITSDKQDNKTTFKFLTDNKINSFSFILKQDFHLFFEEIQA